MTAVLDGQDDEKQNDAHKTQGEEDIEHDEWANTNHC